MLNTLSKTLPSLCLTHPILSAKARAASATDPTIWTCGARHAGK